MWITIRSCTACDPLQVENDSLDLVSRDDAPLVDADSLLGGSWVHYGHVVTLSLFSP